MGLGQIYIARGQWKFFVACTETFWNVIQEALNNHCQEDPARYLHHGQGRDSLFFTVIISSAHRGYELHIGSGDDPVLMFMNSSKN